MKKVIPPKADKTPSRRCQHCARGPAGSSSRSNRRLSAKAEADKPRKPRQVRERNQYGDFVVTMVKIKEREIVVPQNDDKEI